MKMKKRDKLKKWETKRHVLIVTDTESTTKKEAEFQAAPAKADALILFES